jgi:putative oxidoreductase
MDMFNRVFSVCQLPGRLLLSAIFIMSGVHKLMTWSATADSMREEGMTAVPILLAGATAFELFGGLSLLSGSKAAWVHWCSLSS